MTYQTGALAEFKAWTQRIVHDPALADTLPKQWFDSDATAQQRPAVSAEAMVNGLSPVKMEIDLLGQPDMVAVEPASGR